MDIKNLYGVDLVAIQDQLDALARKHEGGEVGEGLSQAASELHVVLAMLAALEVETAPAANDTRLCA